MPKLRLGIFAELGALDDVRTSILSGETNFVSLGTVTGSAHKVHPSNTLILLRT